jgi:hypothetical protein
MKKCAPPLARKVEQQSNTGLYIILMARIIRYVLLQRFWLASSLVKYPPTDADKIGGGFDPSQFNMFVSGVLCQKKDSTLVP